MHSVTAHYLKFSHISLSKREFLWFTRKEPIMPQTEQQYLRVRDAWVAARKNFKRALNNLGEHQRRVGQMEPDARGFEWHFNYAYNMYKPAAQRYLNALKAYTRERPELTGRLCYDYGQEAAVAQHWNDGVSDQHLKSLEKLAVESVKVAHSDWVKNGNKDTMAGVFTAIADAQLMNVHRNPEVKKSAQEVFHLFHQGKVKRDPKMVPVVPTPKIPRIKKPSRRGPLWIETTIYY